MTEPAVTVGFTAQLLAGTECEIGDLLVYNSSTGYWVVATSANRTSAAAGAQAIAMTAYGGSEVGKVRYQMAGTVAASVTGLAAGSAALVKTSSTGRLERVVGTPSASDDVVGYAEADGRVKLCFGMPWSAIASAITAGAVAPGGSSTQLQYRASSTTFGGLEEFTREASGRLNVTTSGYITRGATGGTYPSEGLIRLAQTGDDEYHRLAEFRSANSEDIPIVTVGDNGDGVLLIGGTWELGANEDECIGTTVIYADTFNLKTPLIQWYSANRADVVERNVTYSTSTVNDTQTTLYQYALSGISRSWLVEATVMAASDDAAENAVWMFRCAFNGATPTLSGDLNPYWVRKSSGASAWDCVLDTSAGSVRVRITGAPAVDPDTNWTIRFKLGTGPA